MVLLLLSEISVNLTQKIQVMQSRQSVNVGNLTGL
jgi:hypothetical protein